MKTKRAKRISGPLKYHGGKYYLAREIVALFPKRATEDAANGWIHYVEPYAGGLSVLLANDPHEISEVISDVDGNLTNFWRVLADPVQFDRFLRRAQATPFSENAFRDGRFALQNSNRASQDGWAWAFFVCCRMSMSGRQKAFAPLTRNRTRGGMNEQASAWLSAVEGLPAVHERLRRVAVLHARDACDVIKQQDGPRTLFYLDPPYMPGTRSSIGVYAHEMTVADHIRLLAVLAGVEGRFVLSGYRSDLYDDVAAKHGWNRADFDLPNNAASGESKERKIESVWMNYQGARP